MATPRNDASRNRFSCLSFPELSHGFGTAFIQTQCVAFPRSAGTMGRSRPEDQRSDSRPVVSFTFSYIFVSWIWSRLRVIYVSLASLSFDIDASTETVCTVLGTTVPSNYFCSSQLQSLHACIRVAHHNKNSPRSACFRLGIRTHQKLLALLAALLQHSLQRCFFSNRSLSL